MEGWPCTEGDSFKSNLGGDTDRTGAVSKWGRVVEVWELAKETKVSQMNDP